MVPIIGYTCWNRMGNTVLSIPNLLKSTDDFELHIIDNDSQDDTWNYLQTLKDPRIKEIKKFDKNRGVIYATNYVISKRKPGQSFINIENDVSIFTKNWITNIENMLKEFPEIVLAGNVRPTYFKERHVTYSEIVRNNVKFWRTSHIIGCNMYMPSKTLDVLGYFNEEIYFGDVCLNSRLKKLGGWTGYCPANHILHEEPKCEGCPHGGICSDPKDLYCFVDYKKNYKHKKFYKFKLAKAQKYAQTVTRETIYCPSIHDEESQKKARYNKAEAIKNFKYYSREK